MDELAPCEELSSGRRDWRKEGIMFPPNF